MPIYSVQATVTAATPDGALEALVDEVKKRVKPPGTPDKSGIVKAYQITEWVTGIFTVGTSTPVQVQQLPYEP